MAPAARRVHSQHAAQVPRLIRQLAGPTQAEHDRAFDLLSQMGDLITAEMLDALADPTLPDDAADEVVSLLGATGDERARDPLWKFFEAHHNDPDRASTAALSLSGLGDERVLPFARAALEDDDPERVSNAVAALIALGQLDDIPRLRAVHRRHRADREIRQAAANAVLAILGETDQPTLERTLDQIQASFADRDLWDDIWALMEESFGAGPKLN